MYIMALPPCAMVTVFRVSCSCDNKEWDRFLLDLLAN